MNAAVIEYDREECSDDSSNPLDHFWLEGDSLAPPCQSDIDVVNTILDLVEYNFLHSMDTRLTDRTIIVQSDEVTASNRIAAAAPAQEASCISRLKDIQLFYDLGCGDGRICIEATRRFGCCSIGCEIEERLVERFRAHVKSLDLGSKVSIILGDLREMDLSQKGVISIYLLPEAIEAIRTKLLDALFQGSVIVFNTWGMKGIAPKISCTCGYANNAMLHLYDKSSVE